MAGDRGGVGRASAGRDVGAVGPRFGPDRLARAHVLSRVRERLRGSRRGRSLHGRRAGRAGARVATAPACRRRLRRQREDVLVELRHRAAARSARARRDTPGLRAMARRPLAHPGRGLGERVGGARRLRCLVEARGTRHEGGRVFQSAALRSRARVARRRMRLPAGARTARRRVRPGRGPTGTRARIRPRDLPPARRGGLVGVGREHLAPRGQLAILRRSAGRRRRCGRRSLRAAA